MQSLPTGEGEGVLSRIRLSMCLPRSTLRSPLPPKTPQILNVRPSCRPALACLSAVYGAQSLAAAAASDSDAAARAAAHAARVLAQLQVADPLRHCYWSFRQQELEAAPPGA